MNVTRFRGWFFLVFAAAALSDALGADPDPAPQLQPNILILLTDDQQADAAAALGNPILQTPHIDSLVRNGFRFTNAYCMGSFHGAVCSPSRAMFHTGRGLFHIREDMQGIPVLGEVLARAGYATYGTGKWHNGPRSFARSFQQGRAVMFGGMADHTQVSLVDFSRDVGFTNERIGNKFSSTLFADEAVKFIQGHDAQSPFFVYVTFTAPHDPRQVPPGYEGAYSPHDAKIPASFLGQHPFDNGWLLVRDEMLAPWPRTEQVVREQIADYYALVSHVDHEIGRILTALNESGHRDNTIIVFASDHGLALGGHGLMGKQSLYEHSMKLPLVIGGPGIPRGASSEAFVYLYDVLPTVCGLIGAAPPPGIDGVDLAPIWRGDKTSVRDTVFTAFAEEMRAIRDDTWKLIRYPRINRSQLFNLRADPDETRDLSSDPRQAQILVAMEKKLLAAQRAHGDSLPLSVDNPEPSEIDLTGVPRRPDPYQPPSIVEKYFLRQ